MQGIISVIKPHLAARMGGGDSMSNLAEHLNRVNRQNGRYFVICVGMLVLLFIAAVLVLVWHSSEPGILQTTFNAAIGVPVFGCITYLAYLWRTKLAIDISIALVQNLPDDEAKAALKVLVNKLESVKDRS